MIFTWTDYSYMNYIGLQQLTDVIEIFLDLVLLYIRRFLISCCPLSRHFIHTHRGLPLRNTICGPATLILAALNTTTKNRYRHSWYNLYDQSQFLY